MKVFLLSLIGILLNACPPLDKGRYEVQIEEAEQSFDKIIYRFNDASVPPDSHRSVEYVATPHYATKLVHSYGDTVSFTELAMDTAGWDRLVILYHNATLRPCKVMENAGCTGGTSVDVITSLAGTTLLDGTQYYCGGQMSGNMCGDTDLVEEAIESNFR